VTILTGLSRLGRKYTSIRCEDLNPPPPPCLLLASMRTPDVASRGAEVFSGQAGCSGASTGRVEPQAATHVQTESEVVLLPALLSTGTPVDTLTGACGYGIDCSLSSSAVWLVSEHLNEERRKLPSCQAELSWKSRSTGLHITPGFILGQDTSCSTQFLGITPGMDASRPHPSLQVHLSSAIQEFGPCRVNCWQTLEEQLKALPVTSRGCPLGSDTSRLPHCLEIGLQPKALTVLHPQEDCWYSFLLEAESAPGPKD
jgi:hypothetical protein